MDIRSFITWGLITALSPLAVIAEEAAAGVTVENTSDDLKNIKTLEARQDNLNWWKHAKFGMFIHWGVYSVPDGVYQGKEIPGIGEWIMLNGKIPVAEYKQYAKEFTAANYDPDAWVRLAKQAGMKYIIITSKHHDGFSLFDSKANDWDVAGASPYGKDLLKPLAEACARHGLKLGFYYSQAQDWINGGAIAKEGAWDPAQVRDMDEYLDEVKDIGKIWREVIGKHYPVMAVVQVVALIESSAKVEIETTAVVPNE